MISMSEINAGIVSFVRLAAKEVFGDTKVKVLANDEHTPERPAVRIFTDTVSSGIICSGSRLREISCVIYFYTGDPKQYRTENLKIADILSDRLLAPLELKDGFLVYPENTEVDINGATVICSFDFSMLEDLPETEMPMAEELENEFESDD